MYDLLDWLERERSDHIDLFWRCVFEESILNQYVTLQKLRNSLLDVCREASCRNWKQSIRCEGTTLGKLIQEGHLKVKSYKRSTKAKKSLFSDRVLTVSAGEGDDDFDEEEQDSSSDRQSSTNTTEEEDDAGEQTEEQSDDREDVHKTVFKVTCGDVAAMLHKKRFASGILGKCIRTEKSWMTPVDFVKEVCETDVSWKKDITWEGKPLSDLIEKNILSCHSLLCTCRLCAPDSEDLDNQKNDDECWICRSEEEAELVQCDYCPRSFHQTCHLPHVEDAILEDDRPWMCTFCVFTNTKELFSSVETTAAALSCNISEHMLQCQYLLLYLYNTDQQQIFATNPTLYLSDYTTVVTTPMWFGRVAEKLQEKQYQTVGDFVSDVHLIFTNCASYNRDNPEFTAMGVTVKEFLTENLRMFQDPRDR
ncbi:nuclear body protein SP140-like protein [Sphaeramia orbicularis]|uniref:nuclear body protein SP140-like protein n=1 Tax=Sphaeramia orbicularis TaxID=375764 RepID=UPI0011802799|nr:nuclear body protein SP140-like protein [Sphaeramia orbicularis]